MPRRMQVPDCLNIQPDLIPQATWPAGVRACDIILANEVFRDTWQGAAENVFFVSKEGHKSGPLPSGAAASISAPGGQPGPEDELITGGWERGEMGALWTLGVLPEPLD